MLASYAVVLRRSAIATAPAAGVMIAPSMAVGGQKGLIGALLAVGLVVAFFGISAVVVGLAGRRGPQAMMVAAIATYLTKILVLLFLVGQFQDSTAFNPRLFGLTVIVCVLAYSAAQMVSSMRLKMLYVEPDRDR
jgi:ATP synthase protein I